MWEAGFPCPEPLGPPERHGSLAVSFEGYLSRGEPLPRGTGAAGLWAILFDARKESVQGGLKFAALLKGEVEERLDRAGVRFTLHGHETP